MYKYVICGLLMCFLTGTMTGSEERGLRTAVNIVSEGKPSAVIVISKQASKAAQLGAYELQWHIKKMSGAELPIVTDEADITGNRILVGKNRFTEGLGIKSSDFKSQEYLIRFRPRTIILTGKDKADYGEVIYDFYETPAAYRTWPTFWDEQGTLYAVYDFLQRYCDIRWFDHTEYGIEIPEKETITIRGASIKRAPFFHYRHACWRGSSGYDKYVALLPRSEDDWKRFEEAMYPSLHKAFTGGDYTAAKGSFITLFRLRMREGGANMLCNHSFNFYYNRFWNEESKYFEEKRPEFFAKGSSQQLCYTSPELIEQVVKDARDFFDGKGKKVGAVAWKDYFCLEPMDNATYCKCDECRKWYIGEKDPAFHHKGEHSNYWFNFVNEVAKEIKKSHPDKLLGTLAYSTHTYPPEKVSLEPNVAVSFCFSANRGDLYSEEYYYQLDMLKKWVEESERPLYLWLYYTFPMEFGTRGNYHVFPPFFAHAIGEQFRLFHQYGIKGMFHCGYGQEVEAYVTYRLMDEPTLNVDKLLDEYFKRYYGNAAKPMKELYLAIEDTYTNREYYPETIASRQELSWGYLGTEERMQSFVKLLEYAKEIAKTDVEKKRIELFEIGTWEYMLAGFARYSIRKTSPLPVVNVPKVKPSKGSPENVDWEKAANLPEGWYERGSADRSERKFEAKVAHDGNFLYLKLIDPCETAKLHSSPGIFAFDTWELFVAAQRDLPYRQFAFGPGGLMVALSHGEVAWRTNVKIGEHNIRFVSDTTKPDRWLSYIAVSFEDLIQKGIKPGEKFYMNIIRVSNPALVQSSSVKGIPVDSWTSYVTVHEVDRLAEFVLEE